MGEKPSDIRKLIYLAGFMGSGKSTIGPILANTLGYTFVDVDRQIEQETGKSVASIFKEDGESGFRAIEHTILERVSGMDEIVVSLGGGTVAHEDNFRLIRSGGVMVYLQLSPEEAMRRMKHKTDRPLLQDKEGNPLPEQVMEQRIRELLVAREKFYNRADIIVPTELQNVGRTVDEIVKKLRRFINV
jgi:shikimate kinase